MKSKTINAVICKKFDDWISTIADDNVRSLVEKNTIITGGCIASMLMQEPINDFDVYFSDKETVLAVVNYYVKIFKEQIDHKHQDGNQINIFVEDVDGRIKTHIKSAGIAGAKGENDYQYFESRPPEEGEDYIESVVNQVSEVDTTIITTENKERYYPVFISANAITLSDKIQIVNRFYGDPDNIHQHYDYIHCTNYWISSTRKCTFKLEALQALMARDQ